MSVADKKMPRPKIQGKSRSKLMLYVLMVIVLLCGAALAYDVFGADEEDEYKSGLPVEKVVVMKQDGGKQVFKLEIAAKPIDIQIGLMHRKSMPPNHGMMFQMGKTPRHVSFWMKNTLIPLDMLFVAADGSIINIHHNATPLSLTGIPSQGPITAVIELNGGRAEETGIRIGDRVLHPYFGTAEE